MKGEELADVDIPDIFTISYLKMSDGAQLRRLHYQAKNPKGLIFMLPGMNTLVLSWIKVLNLLVEENYSIEYVETREKYTAIVGKEHKIDRERMLQDLVDSIEALDLTDKEYIAIGSSLGATQILHILASGKLNIPHSILVGPSRYLTIPFAFRVLLYFVNDFTYDKLLKRFTKFVVLNAYTNKKADPMQHRKYSLALDLAKIGRLKRAIRAWYHNRVDDDLPLIDGSLSKCYLVGASKDKLHPDTDTKFISDNIQNSEFVDLGTNTDAHDQPLIDLIKSISIKF